MSSIIEISNIISIQAKLYLCYHIKTKVVDVIKVLTFKCLK